MKRDITYLHDLVAKIDARLDDLAEISARHDENLLQHMKRSDQNEQAIEMLKKHVNMVNGVGVFLGLLATIAAIYAGVR
jgi:hypothetical protein